MCRQPLLWLGCADPVASLFEAIAEDPGRETLDRILTAWQAAFGKAPAMVREAVRLATSSFDEHVELREVLRDIADERGEINRRKLGWWIKRHAGRIVNGRRFIRASGNRSAEAWQVDVVESVSPVSSVIEVSSTKIVRAESAKDRVTAPETDPNEVPDQRGRQVHSDIGTPSQSRQTHCPAFPKSGKLAGASWSWCQSARGKMKECRSCPWGVNSQDFKHDLSGQESVFF